MAVIDLACRPSPRLCHGLLLWCLCLSGACGLLVECALGWRILAIAVVWTLFWPAGLANLAQGARGSVRRLTRNERGAWTLYDRQGLHYVELLSAPLRLGPLFWLTFRGGSRRWHVCLDAKVMEPVELRALQLMIRELPGIRDR